MYPTRKLLALAAIYGTAAANLDEIKRNHNKHNVDLRFNSSKKFTILQLTDLHFNDTPDDAITRDTCDRVSNGVEPDLVVITGDIVDG